MQDILRSQPVELAVVRKPLVWPQLAQSAVGAL
jgi:hypothetical protein